MIQDMPDTVQEMNEKALKTRPMMKDTSIGPVKIRVLGSGED